MPDNYWKCEYENLRRKKNKQIEDMKRLLAVFAEKTWRLLRLLGMPEEEIIEYYRRANGNDRC